MRVIEARKAVAAARLASSRLEGPGIERREARSTLDGRCCAEALALPDAIA